MLTVARRLRLMVSANWKPGTASPQRGRYRESCMHLKDYAIPNAALEARYQQPQAFRSP